MKAKNKKEFEAAWNSTIDQLYALCHSLPTTQAVEFLDLVPKVKQFVKIASENVYGAEKAE